VAVAVATVEAIAVTDAAMDVVIVTNSLNTIQTKSGSFETSAFYFSTK
jgi:hypothetical protein